MELYVLIDRQESGPHTEQTVRAMIDSGEIRCTTLAWREEMTEWQPLENLLSLPATLPPIPDGLPPIPEVLPPVPPIQKEPEDPLIPDRANTTPVSGQGPRRMLIRVATVSLSIILVAVLGIWLYHQAQRYPGSRPSRDAFNYKYSRIRMTLIPNGEVVIDDQSGQTLIIGISPEYGPSHELGENYDLTTHCDKLAEPSYDPDDREHTGSMESIRIDIGEEIPLDHPTPDPKLSAAIDALIDWSITAADNHTTVLTRVIDIGDVEDDYYGGYYVFHCDQARNEFSLKMRSRPNPVDFPNREDPVIFSDTMITTYSRAHLWRYLFDHYGDIVSLADGYYKTLKAGADQADASARAQEEQQALIEQKADEDRGKAEKAEAERLDRLFVRPSPNPSAPQ